MASLNETNRATNKPSQTTTAPSPAARTRHNMPPRPPEPPSAAGALSPSFSRAPFITRLGAAAAAAPSSSSSSPEEHPCVTLLDWWLVRVEGDRRKIAVSGFTERNDAFTSAAITKRYEPLSLQDEEGIVVFIDGSLSISRMVENGFPLEICEQFSIGFPYWWENWDSHMESHPNSFKTSNSRDGSTQFYLGQFQLGNFLKKAGSSLMMNLRKKTKNFSIGDMDAFMKCSSSSNETQRFEEYTCNMDISEKEKSAASNAVSEGSAGVANEVHDVEVCLTMPSISQERGHVDTECNECLDPTEKSTVDETYKEARNQNDDMHPDARGQESDRSCEATPVTSLKNQCCLINNEYITLNQKAVGPTEKQRYAHEVLQASARSPVTRCKVSYAHESPLTRSKANLFSISTPESLKMKRTRSGRVIVPTLDQGSQWIVYGSDGLISGVAQSPSHVQGTKSATRAKKKRDR